MGRMRSAWSIMARSVRRKAKDWASCLNLRNFPLAIDYSKEEHKTKDINQRGKISNQTPTCWNEDNCIVFMFEENGDCYIFEDMNSTTSDKFEILKNGGSKSENQRIKCAKNVDVARSEDKFQFIEETGDAIYIFLQGGGSSSNAGEGENKSKKRRYAPEGRLSKIEEISEAQETNDEDDRRASVESSDHGSSGSFSFPVLSNWEWTGCPTQIQGQECSLCGPSELQRLRA